MSASTCEEVAEVHGGLEVCADRLCEFGFDKPGTRELLRIMDCMYRVARKLRVPGHVVIDQLCTRATVAGVARDRGCTKPGTDQRR